MIANFSNTTTITTKISPELVPEQALQREFAYWWWRYLEYRFRQFDEILDEQTQVAQLAWLVEEPDPIATLKFTIRSTNKSKFYAQKSLRPLDDWGRQQYKLLKPKERYAVRTSRSTRNDTSKPVTDTVLAPRNKCGIGKSRETADDGQNN